uniref:Uncharacterized protein n=1 Tax=Caenorhabditis japonica TaxID=281687 RepID=A0A8R1INB9_CAEJA
MLRRTTRRPTSTGGRSKDNEHTAESNCRGTVSAHQRLHAFCGYEQFECDASASVAEQVDKVDASAVSRYF